MDYLDFELRITTGQGAQYPVAVLRSPSGEMSGTMHLALSDASLRRHLTELEHARSALHTRRGIKAPTTPIELDVGSVREFGATLFEALFPPEVRSCYRNSLNAARREGKGLRLRLRIEAPELSALPWEYLYDPAEGDYLSLSVETPLVRYLELARPVQTLNIEPPISILGMVASPEGLPTLDVGREKEQMERAIEHLIDRGVFSLTWLEGQTWRDLQEAMRDGPWHVFHFIGHGGFDQQSSEGYLSLSREDGTTHRLTGTQLGRLLAGHHSMRLAVLNSCEGARASQENIYSSTGALLIRRGIPSVVSMQYEISDQAALEFSRTFYDTLADNLPVDRAVSEARKAMSMIMDDSVEWATPVLYLRAPDGQLFHLDVGKAIFKERRNPAPATSKQRPTDSATPPPPAVAAKTDRGLDILLKKVRQYWIEGVLERSFLHDSLIELELGTMPQMVDSPWGEVPLSGSHTITDAFNELGRSLLILGIPGSGKTTTMLALARALLAKAEANPGQPVPVVLNLSSWGAAAKPLSEWMADELSNKYLIPRQVTFQWLQSNRLLLLLDGLDEVRVEQRTACVEAINAFIGEQSMTGIIVCCRLNDYLQLPVRLLLNGAVNLRDLSREQVLHFVAVAGPAHASLLEALQRDSSLQVLAQTPFMLSLMMRLSGDLPAAEAASNTYGSIESKKQELMEAFVQRQFRTRQI